MELDPPIRQGQTRYPYLVVQFVRDEDVEATIHLSEYVPLRSDRFLSL